MENFDASVHLGDDGNFTDQFYTDLPEGLQGNEFLKRAGGVGNLIKVATDTKSAFDAKMDNVIQRPGETATDQEKTDFQTAMSKEFGFHAPENTEGYDLQYPEGMKGDEEKTKAFKEFCLSKDIPSQTARDIFDFRTAELAAEAKADEDAFTEASKKLQTDWSGDKMVVNARSAHDALMQFVNDDFKAALKEAKLYDNPGDLSKWRDFGLDPIQLRIWAGIGNRMQSGSFLKGSSNNMTADEQKAAEHKQAVNAVNARTPQFQV